MAESLSIETIRNRFRVALAERQFWIRDETLDAVLSDVFGENPTPDGGTASPTEKPLLNQK